MARKRLQVLLEQEELSEIKRAAQHQRMSVADYLRHALRQAGTADADADTRRKLTVISEASRHAYPTADIGEMLAEIEQGHSR